MHHTFACEYELFLRRVHQTKNPAAKAKWTKLATVIMLARTIKSNPSIILMSQDKSIGRF